MPTINFVNEKKQVEVPAGTNLRRAALDAGVELYNGLNGYGASLNKYINCKGLGHCGTCTVLITKGMENTSRKGWMETLRMKLGMIDIGREDTTRLSCRVRVNGDIDVETKPAYNMCGENFFS